MDDCSIINLFFDRSESAINELKDKYGSLCGRIAENILKNRQDAEECVNDTYLSVWNTIPPQRPRSLSAYVCRIVRNRAISLYRKNTAQKRNSYYDAALEELGDYISDPFTLEEQYDEKATTWAINSFLETLEKEDRIMFMMRYWYCYSVKEVAKAFDITPNNAAVRLSRIKEKFKRYLEDEGVII